MTDESVIAEPAVVRVSSTETDEALVEAGRGVADTVSVVEVGSTGATRLEPLVMATRDGMTAFYARCSADRIGGIVEALGQGTPPTSEADVVVEHDPDIGEIPSTPLRPFDVGTRDVLGRCGWVRSTSPADHDASGGFVAAQTDPDEALDRIVGLTGRGWGDVATDGSIAEQWRRVGSADAPVVVVNAHGTPADGLLIESAPLAVLEGALVASRVVGAEDVVVYVSEERPITAERARRAADAVTANVSGIETTIRVVAGPDSYKAGEMTMALEAIEGNHRLEARVRPPGPTEHGLHGRPTLIHTPCTFAQVERAVADPDRDDTRLFTVTGDVRSPATIELPAGQPVSTALDAVEVTGDVKAACVGGEFGGVTRDLSVAATSEALVQAGLGTDGVVEVLNEDRCVVAFAGDRARFAHDENCGRCVPCREGSKQLTELLRAIYDGDYQREAIHELARVMHTSSICEFGVNAPRPVTTAIEGFEDEFVAHAEGRCPADACDLTDGARPGEVSAT